MDSFNHSVDGNYHIQLDKEQLTNEFDIGHELACIILSKKQKKNTIPPHVFTERIAFFFILMVLLDSNVYPYEN
ncbi:hypothetical protein [Bacillus wiedmannii]|uniref:hypothetical protein n=1 Tax=Bacillus wiedmannii TaxID=1890302 RepID=UPI003D97178A